MVNIVGFLQGVRESNDYWTKKAAEARDEYNRYVQSNPDSTVDERIERQKLLGGGMDYLTRLMPEKSNVTKNVGVQTQFRQDQQDQRDRAAAAAGYAANRDSEAQERYKEWQDGAANRKSLSDIQLDTARLNRESAQFRNNNMADDQLALELSRKLAATASIDKQQAARRSEALDFLALEKDPTYKDFTDYMEKSGIYSSFGKLISPEQFKTQLQDRKNTIEINQRLTSSQMKSYDYQIADGSVAPLLNMFNDGSSFNSQTPIDKIITEYTKLNPEFGELDAGAQNYAIFTAKQKHDSNVAQKIQASIAAWADKNNGSNADPDQWGREGQFGSEFDPATLSPSNQNLITNLKAQASNTARNNEEAQVKRLFSQQVASATSEDEIKAIKASLGAQFPLLGKDKLNAAFDGAKVTEAGVRDKFKVARKQAVNNLNSNFEKAIIAGNFANLADVQKALASELASVSHLNIPSQDITNLEDTLTEEFETNLTREATKANEAEKTNAMTAVAEDNALTVASFQTTEQAVKSIESVGSLVSPSLSLSESDRAILGTNLTSAYQKMSVLAKELGIPLNKEFVEATLISIATGNHSDSLSIVSANGVLEQTLLDAMQENLSETYSTSPSMRKYMSTLSVMNLSRDRLGVSLSALTEAQRRRVGQEWGGPGGGKTKYYEEKFDVIPAAGLGAVGHPRHGGKRDAGLVLTVEQIEKDAAVDVNLTTQNVSEVLTIVNGIQADAKAWTDIYSGQNAQQPFSLSQKTEFSNSRSDITDKLKRNAAAVKDLLIGAVEDKEKISAQIQQGSFYESQISNSNVGTKEKMLGHIRTLDQNIQQFQRLYSTLSSLNQTLTKTEMDLEPRGVNEIRNKYLDLGAGGYNEDDVPELLKSQAFDYIERAISGDIDELLANGFTNTRDLLREIESRNVSILQTGQAGRYGDGRNFLSPDQFDVAYRDALESAMLRRDVMEMQAEESQVNYP